MEKYRTRAFATSPDIVAWLNKSGIDRSDIISLMHVDDQYILIYYGE